MSCKSPTDPQEVDTAAAAASKTTETTAASQTTTNAAKKKSTRMSQERIDSLIRYPSMYFPEDAIPKVSKEVLAQANLADKGDLPVPMDKLDDYIAKIFRRINESEPRIMRERDRILNEYYTRGYVEEVSATPPPPGRRRFRPGVTKQAAGKTKKLN